MHLIQGKKKGAQAPFFCKLLTVTSDINQRQDLFSVALTELVDLLCGLQNVLLAGVKGV